MRLFMRLMAQICLILYFLLSGSLTLGNTCEHAFEIHQKNEIAKEYFSSLAQLIEENKREFIEILVEIDNRKGAEYEIEQAIKTLRGVEHHELGYLNEIGNLKNIAVYGSTNIPLYTLVLHTLIPGSTGAHVWFRTPSRSRDTYLKLFKLFTELSPLDLSNIHILHEKRDVQYDDFRRKYVLRLTKSRKNLKDAHGPADVVLFTGKPETGFGIRDRNIEKLEEIGFQGQQLFMQFGTGLNPVILTDKADQLVNKLIEDTVLSIQINSSQDCIAPKFYLIHSRLSEKYLSQIKDRVASLRFGTSSDVHADFSPLTFSENLDELAQFRNTYEDYLVNKEALIDKGSKRVDPHIFVFPFSMFDQIPLVDHYAPFIIHFVYDQNDQLYSAANDPRVRKRAMFATIYGDHGDTDLAPIRKAFEDNFHSTIMNQSVFVEESGNFPFGGFSGDASSLTLIKGRLGQVTSFTFNKPLLFSREVSEFFSNSSIEKKQGLSSSGGPKNTRGLDKLISMGSKVEPLRLSDGSESAVSTGGVVLDEGAQRFSIEQLTEQARKEGLYTYVHKASPQTKQQRDSDLLMYGSNIIYRDQAASFSGEGVVLHPSFAGKETRNLNAVRGRINPHLGYLSFHDILRDNKDLEYKLIEGIYPGAMPRSRNFRDFITDNETLGSELNELRMKVNHLIENRDYNELNKSLRSFLQRLFAAINKEFPKGAFLKNFNEWATGDLGNQVTSFSQNEEYLVWEFQTSLEQYVEGRPQDQSIDFTELTQSNYYATGLKFISQLLHSPEQILIQERVQVASTQLGFPLEFRVDFIYGQAIGSNLRYSHEYYPEEAKQAQSALDDFFSKAPLEIQMLSGGADVARLSSGEYVILEFNFGSASGSLLPEIFPIRSNIIKSKLQGRDTPLISLLDQLFNEGPDAQKRFLMTLEEETDLWIKKGIHQMSRSEVAKYFRDQYLESWTQNPTRESADQILDRLKLVFDGVFSETTRDPDLLIKGAENFISLHLLRSSNESL